MNSRASDPGWQPPLRRQDRGANDGGDRRPSCCLRSRQHGWQGGQASPRGLAPPLAPLREVDEQPGRKRCSRSCWLLGGRSRLDAARPVSRPGPRAGRPRFGSSGQVVLVEHHLGHCVGRTVQPARIIDDDRRCSSHRRPIPAGRLLWAPGGRPPWCASPHRCIDTAPSSSRTFRRW